MEGGLESSVEAMEKARERAGTDTSKIKKNSYAMNKKNQCWQLKSWQLKNNSVMEEDKEEGINRNSNVDWNDDSNLNQYETLHDKWNAIQDAYLRKYPQLEDEDLYFESGGFDGVLLKISEVRGKPVEEIRSEIEKW